ncbi:MAG: hypothetical protein HUJ25_08140 [Crocinitomicaceae bacterium]|nr:hypothetical protein [Crocinitomicaceae bacterium]
MMTQYAFHCPSCGAHLNRNEKIVLKTRRSNGDEGEIEMSTSVGNYEYQHNPDVLFSPGEIVDFICTSCNAELNSKEFENYALLNLKVAENIVFDVLFSRQAGVQKTYLVTEDGIETYSGN